ncbi:MAG: DUF424 family protein [Candidatus Marsarchaeota archaeon]|jgi:hypothetical protein|nr:DUF424 family protein [Candidatus Marsarchaeota archaeon]
MPLIYIKSHRTDEGFILAMCDQSLLGSVLEDGDTFIDIKSYAEFYRGDLVDGEGALSRIDRGSIMSVNAVGKEAVDAAIDASLIKSDSVRYVKGVPYAQAFRVDY